MAIASQSQLILQCREWKRNGKRVVCALGAFDLLHPGHIRLLEEARGLGDILVVAVESDATVTSERGPGRPVTPSTERAEILSALAAVDFVVELDDKAHHMDFFLQLAPDFIVQGGKANTLESISCTEGGLKAAGTQVVHIPLEPGHSTSRLVERIKQFHA